MLNRLLSALLVAIVVYLGCIILAGLLSVAHTELTDLLAGFLSRFAMLIAVAAGVWAFLNRSFLLR